MPSLKATLLLERDGVEVKRLVRRIETTDVQTFTSDRASAGFAALPIGEMAEVQALLVEAGNQQTNMTLRLDAQSDAGIVINAGGFVFMIGVDIDAGVTTNATLSVPGTMTVTGLAAGA